MAENSQLSDETKNNSTDTSSTDVSSAVIGNHENAIVPHKISNHDKLVQTMVMVDGEWINVNDTNDQANVKYDMHKVNKKVVEAQKGIVEAKNTADSAVKYADSAVSASKVNSDAIVAQSSAISEAKAATDSATAEVQQLKANAASDAASIRADVAAASETLMGQGKQIATINTTLDGLNTKYEGFSDNLSKLSGTVATNSTQIDQNKKSIALKADQATVDNLSGEVSRNTAQLKVQADQISSKVSSEDFSALDNKVGSAIAQIDKNTTAIDQTNKQISLKADQTVVDTIKNTATQNSSRLDVMDKAIQSKVTSTDVNNIINEKGFTTQSTVQSLIEQKAGTLNESITKLDSKIDESGGGINLQGGTADCSLPIGSNGPRITIENYDDHTKMIHAVGSKSGFYIDYDKGRFIPEVGETYTFSADIKGKGTINGNLFKYEGADRSSMGSITLNNNWQRIKTTVHVSQLSGTWIIYPNPDNGNNDFYVKNIKIERGSIATPYSQAPSDNASVSQLQSVTASIDGLQSAVKNKVDQSQYTQLAGVVQTKVSQSDFNRLNNQVNVQTLDNANIDNMKTTGHYFVHNLTGNPLGGWVYVDVTGNANDRIRQDVYQDSGTKHAFRRWFGTYWTGWSTGAEESEITQLRSDINLRVKSGDLLSQINIAAGHTLIQSNKIYFDADSFVMSPNSKAFIPSAYITNINADKITTGTLDAAKFNVKNFSADNIVGGTLSGVVVKTGDNDRYFQTSKDNIYWVRKGSMSLVGNDTYLNRANGLNIADMNNIQLTTWGGASVNPDGSIVNTSGNAGHPKIVVDTNGNWDPDDPYGTKWGGGPGDSEIAQWVGNKEYTVLTRNQGFTVHLNDGNNKSVFAIQKDNKVGFYVGGGDDGGEIRIAGAGPIKLQGRHIDDGFDDGMTHTFGNVQVDNLHVRKWLGVDQSKNAIVKTSQGPVTINAYETAEYYFGDIGEGQTDFNGIAYVGIEKLFNETVNTNIPYQVFLTAYGSGNLWVAQREHNRFVVKSDQPNIKFGWEIKAKRKGYEYTRLQNVDEKLNHMEATS